MGQQFTSDNTAGMCPQALAAFVEANLTGHEDAYGEDTWTAKVCDRIRDVFECDAEVFFVFNGTAANSLILAAMCQSYHSVICHQMAHVDNDECGAPGFFSGGSTLLVSNDPLGKLTPKAIEDLVTQRHDIHYPKPKVISLTQATECGTVYSVNELQAIGKTARRLGLHVHMDGARFANAVVSLNATPADLTWRAGIDAMVFGGTKNGLPMGEAVVFFNKDLATDFAYRLKQAGQLASKMRFISAPWLGLLDNDVWLENARHANAMAKRLHVRVKDLKGVKVMFQPQANGVFLGLDHAVQDGLRARGWVFLVSERGCRFMCSWDVLEETVDKLCRDIEVLCA
ncbi:MAG: low specificity L-threonine aldolase [Magnetovibrio sp.]|nr:low specificity L-threonine aldolase [Magnetovibrio sp.]